MRPFFSIITTCYNCEKTIHDTLSSVLNQTHNDYEYIIIDACSTDTTIDILKEYEPKFHGRMKLISEPDKGIYDGMNKGIKISKGNYISILNGDDYYHPETLETVSGLTKNKRKLPIIIGDICRVTFEKREIYRYHFNYNRIRNKIAFGHPSMFLPKIIYDAEGVYDISSYSLAADIDFQQRLYTHFDKYDWIISEKLFTYMREGGATDNPRNRKQWIKELADIDMKYKNVKRSNAIINNTLYIYGRVLKKLFPYSLQKIAYELYRG